MRILENLIDDAIALLYVTKFSTISFFLTKLCVTYSFAIASSVAYSKIHQNLSNSVGDVRRWGGNISVYLSLNVCFKIQSLGYNLNLMI